MSSSLCESACDSVEMHISIDWRDCKKLPLSKIQKQFGYCVQQYFPSNLHTSFLWKNYCKSSSLNFLCALSPFLLRFLKKETLWSIQYKNFKKVKTSCWIHVPNFLHFILLIEVFPLCLKYLLTNAHSWITKYGKESHFSTMQWQLP